MKKPDIKSQKGQLIVEAVLILVAMMAVTFATINYFKKEEFVKQMIAGPWVGISGMIQNGNWGSTATTGANHPNAHSRHVSIQGVSP